MTKLIALIDGSAYAQSVLDHAAWAANRTAASVDVVHVIGRRDLSSTPFDLSGSLELGARSTLLNELAEHDAQRAKLAQQIWSGSCEPARSLYWLRHEHFSRSIASLSPSMAALA